MWIYTDEYMLLHDPGAAEPERPSRLRSILASLREDPPVNFEWKPLRAAEWSELEQVHDKPYLEHIRKLDGKVTSLDWDTHLNEHTVQSALLAAGAGFEAVDAVLGGSCKTAFALVRPPGHHAERGKAMGYCLFNNIALAAEHAIRAHGLERVLIIDWDVHHGNGTDHIFEERDDVLVFNSHQWPLYPGTGAAEDRGVGKGIGFTINVPLPEGSGDDVYEAAFREHLLPAADRFRPQLVLLSAGFDAHELDPLGGMQVTDAGYGRLAKLVRGIAEKHAQGRVIAMLEGGYDLKGLVGGVRATMAALGD